MKGRSHASLSETRRASHRSARALHVLRQFRLIYGTVRQQFREIERTCNLSGSQLWMLQEINSAPGIGVTRLAQKLSIHQTTCSQLSDKLLAAGYVTKARSRKDQRRVGLTATRAAKLLLMKSPGPAEGVLPEALAALPAGSLGALRIQLDRVIARLRVRNKGASRQPMSEFM